MHDADVILASGGPNTLVGRCPFHDDHAPSLWLYPDSGLRGCNRPATVGAGVHDVINFRALTLLIQIGLSPPPNSERDTEQVLLN